MNKAIEIKKLGQLEVLTASVPYTQDPTRLFHTLCENKTDSLLLESAEIDSKQDLKSLLIVDSAVRIVCFGHTVSMHALTNNGKNLLSHLNQNIRGEVESKFDGETLTLEFDQPCDTLDEDSRLREASSFDALRLVQHSFDISLRTLLSREQFGRSLHQIR